VTRGNAHIQKLVAYENAFQVLLDIVRSEDESELFDLVCVLYLLHFLSNLFIYYCFAGSIVSEDCLFVVLNLLKNNASNQELFREQGFVLYYAI
jgi:hypothetical protein